MSVLSPQTDEPCLKPLKRHMSRSEYEAATPQPEFLENWGPGGVNVRVYCQLPHGHDGACTDKPDLQRFPRVAAETLPKEPAERTADALERIANELQRIGDILDSTHHVKIVNR